MGRPRGVPRWSAPRGEGLAGTGAGGGVGMGWPPRGGHRRGKPTTPAGLAANPRDAGPPPAPLTGEGAPQPWELLLGIRKGSEVTSVKKGGGNVTGRVT